MTSTKLVFGVLLKLTAGTGTACDHICARPDIWEVQSARCASNGQVNQLISGQLPPPTCGRGQGCRHLLADRALCNSRGVLHQCEVDDVFKVSESLFRTVCMFRCCSMLSSHCLKLFLCSPGLGERIHCGCNRLCSGQIPSVEVVDPKPWGCPQIIP